ncbi:hypothetical protein [Vulcanisaeta distributa]|uniref:hypothetical protein n=1 Tax=Vulcanisaeta distributa TaxID=164451 RepID=UPI000AA9401D|nr:hypothetical protein [Vulcanisaeta distributa]
MKAKGSRRLECGDPVNEPRVVEEAMRLINEFMNRVEKHRNALLNESTTPFDETIKALTEWLQKIEEKIKESNDENITNLRKSMLKVGRKMLMLAEQAREKWLKVYKRELEELIEELGGRGKVAIMIRGDPFNKDKSFTAHLYTKNLTIEVSRVARSGGVTITMNLTGLRGGFHIVTPKLFSDGKLRAMQRGLLLTDGSIDNKGYPEMGTNQLWQSVAWLIAWPGRNSMNISSVGINDQVSITWYLKAISHKGVIRSKAMAAEEVSELGNEEFPLFLLFAILGDGSVDIGKKRRITLTMGGGVKHDLWGGSIIERLRSLGFRKKDERYEVTYVVWASKAVEIARKMLDNHSIKALIEDLSTLLDADKLRRLITLANMRVKPKGRSSIEVAGIKMTVYANRDGYVELRISRSNYNDAVEILMKLKSAGYEEIELRRWVVGMQSTWAWMQ